MPAATETAPAPVKKQKPKNGTPCGHNDVVPEGMYRQPMSNGTYELWALPPENFNPHERSDVLREVDKAFAAIKPTKEFPNRPVPTEMRVNKHFRSLFRNQTQWSPVSSFIANSAGDIEEQVTDVPIVGETDDFFASQNPTYKSDARFAFVDKDGTILNGK